MFDRILVAMDLSTTQEQVFERAVFLAKAANARLMLLHVFSPNVEGFPDPTVFPVAYGMYPILQNGAAKSHFHQWERLEQQNQELLRSLCEKAANQGVTTEFSQNVGVPEQVICDIASTWKADLIVMGRRGLSGMKEFLLGSVSNYVMHHAPCSVLTVQHSVNEDSEVMGKGQAVAEQSSKTLV